MTEAISTIVSALEREGFVGVNDTPLGESSVAIDFTAPSEIVGKSARGRSSSLIVGTDGEPETFVIRFPALSSEEYSSALVFDALDMAIIGADMAAYAEPLIGGAGGAGMPRGNLNPHIQSIESAEIPVRATVLARKFATATDAFYGGL